MTCDPNATCHDLVGNFECRCNEGFFGDGNSCDPWVAVNECETGDNDCASNADCIDLEGRPVDGKLTEGFTCACPAGFSDDSEDSVEYSFSDGKLLISLP